jgi:hypothetical protein
VNQIPEDLLAALKENGLAAFFDGCTAAHQREYLKWIAFTPVLFSGVAGGFFLAVGDSNGMAGIFSLKAGLSQDAAEPSAATVRLSTRKVGSSSGAV